MDAPWKVIAAFVGVFIAGAIFGGVFTMRVSVVRRPPAPPAARPLTQIPAPTTPRPQVAGPQVAVVASTAPVTPQVNPLTPTLMRQFTQKLNLTAEQRDRIRPVVARASEDYQRLRQENLTDTARVTERMYADVSAALTSEQRAQLETMRQQMLERVQVERKKRADAAAAEAASRERPNASRAPAGP